MEKYEDPTQRLHSKFPTQEYRDNYDKIFGKKKYWYEEKLEKEDRTCTTCGAFCDQNYARHCGETFAYWEPKRAKEEVVVHSD